MAFGDIRGCIAALGSMTSAVKGQRALIEHGLACEIIPLDATQTRRSCAYGLAFRCEELARVRRALRAAGIAASQFLQTGGDPS